MEISNNSKFSVRLKQILRNNSALFAFIILFILAIFIKGEQFLNINNITNVLMNNSFIGIIALGMTLIIITGNIDLAVGSQLASAGLVTILVMNTYNSIWLGVISGILIGILTGYVSGFVVSKFMIPSFIVTLGTMQVYRSLSLYFFNGGGVMGTSEAAKSFVKISNTKLFEVIPMPIIYWILISILMAYMMDNTRFGRHIYAVGSNERATFLSSINVERVKIWVFALSGFLVSISAILEASRLGSMNSSSSGRSYEMDAIAAVVIGGTAMSGGKGTVLGTVLGTLTLGIINNLMNLMGVNSFLVGAIKGLIIIGAVMLQRSVTGKEE